MAAAVVQVTNAAVRNMRRGSWDRSFRPNYRSPLTRYVFRIAAFTLRYVGAPVKIAHNGIQMFGHWGRLRETKASANVPFAD